MELIENADVLKDTLSNVIKFENGIKIIDRELFINQQLDKLVDNLEVSKNDEVRSLCKWIIWETARETGIYPSSIHELYMARARGEIEGFTVPAMNLRVLPYEMARAIIRVAKKYNTGAFIFEIAKSEIGYTDQSPSEYASVCLAAALKEQFEGPLFIQGDHFQINAADYKRDPKGSIDKIKKLISKAVKAGFYNIDIDSSTLVDLSKFDIPSQQEDNYKVCTELTKHIRLLQPEDIIISIGGEIGEVGGKNSTPEELEAFMAGYNQIIGEDTVGISKISIQTGSSHGGVVLPDGSIAKVKIDFDTLKDLSKEAREKYDMAGAVQHGASTLPKEAFGKFPEVECAEVHLATNFQNIVYDSESFPSALRNEIYEYVKENFSSERKEGQTEEQFIYKLRKKALCPFKKQIVNLSKDIKQAISEELEKEFDFLFKQLKVEGTKEYTTKYISIKEVPKSKRDFEGKFIKNVEALEGAD